MDELTVAQTKKLHQALLALRDELSGIVDGLADGTRPVEPDSAIGRISRMEAIQVQQMAQASRRTARRRQQQVAAALQRVAEGEYGECAECGDDIGFARLKARPEAPFCLTCQGRREKGG